MRQPRKKQLTPFTTDVLIALNYYTPYISGLTNVARDVAEYLVQQGLRVTVVTTRHDKSLPIREVINGVEVRRAAVIARVDRAPISPTFVRDVIRLGRRSKLVNLHLPMPEAGAIAVGLGSKTPLVLTYQCDPPVGLSRRGDLVAKALDTSHRIATKRADRVIASSLDYASSSRVLGPLSSDKLLAIPPTSWPRAGGNPTLRQTEDTHFGFLGRLTSEKGADVLVRAFRRVARPDQRLLIAGEGLAVSGDSAYSAATEAAGDDRRIIFLGRIPDEQLADFYASIDVFCLPSTNSFEAFGIVQVEALLAGVPVIASDLPGVRTPTQQTGFGILTVPGSEDSLAEALADPDIAITAERQGKELAAAARHTFGIEKSLAPYESIYAELAEREQPTRIRQNLMLAASHSEDMLDSYTSDYYAANGQEGDRIALRWYASLLNRYARTGPALDVGCGTGWLVKRLLRTGPADGLEHSPYARSQAQARNPSSTFFKAISDVPDHRYTKLSCIHVVEHIAESDLPELVREWKRVLTQDGTVLVVTPDPSGAGEAIRGEQWRGYDDPTHITLRPHIYWRKLLTENGFEIVAEGSDGLWDPPYGSWLVDRARLVPIATQVLAGRVWAKPGSGESAVIVARLGKKS